MKSVWLIIGREYFSRVKRKSFIITTALAPLGILVLMVVQVLIITQGIEKKRVVISDESSYFTEGNRVKMKDSPTLYFKASTESLESLKENYFEQGFDGVLHVPKIDIENPNGIQFYSESPLGLASRTMIEQELSRVLRNEKIIQYGIDPDKLDDLKTSVTIGENKVSKDSEATIETSSQIAAGAGGFMGFLMYLTIIIYGSMVMRGVAEEKSNRIVEVMLSRVKPFKLMLGKIIGIGLVGLTQFAIWIVSAGLVVVFAGFIMSLFIDPAAAQQLAESQSSGSTFSPEDAEMMVESFMSGLSSLPLGWMLFTFLFYFFGGYMLYASLFAAVGSAVGDNSNESQALVFPITIPIIISFVMLTVIIENPNGSMAFWGSVIPLTSPVIMPARIAYGLSPFSLDFILSIVLLIGGFLLSAWVAAKIYRTAILLTGKKITLKEMWRWVR